MTTKDERTQARATADKWRNNPNGGATAALGAAILGGQWTSRNDAEAAGVATSVVGQVVAQLRTAGYDVETKVDGPYGLKAYRVATAEAASTKGVRRTDIDDGRHDPTPTHPPVGAKVVVKAVALGARGALVVHLSDGNGNAWAATITGYVS